MTAGPSGESATPLSFMSSSNLLQVHSTPLSRSLMKMLNQAGPHIAPCGTPLITAMQPGCSAQFHVLLLLGSRNAFRVEVEMQL